MSFKNCSILLLLTTFFICCKKEDLGCPTDGTYQHPNLTFKLDFVVEHRYYKTQDSIVSKTHNDSSGMKLNIYDKTIYVTFDNSSLNYDLCILKSDFYSQYDYSFDYYYKKLEFQLYDPLTKKSFTFKGRDGHNGFYWNHYIMNSDKNVFPFFSGYSDSNINISYTYYLKKQ